MDGACSRKSNNLHHLRERMTKKKWPSCWEDKTTKRKTKRQIEMTFMPRPRRNGKVEIGLGTGENHEELRWVAGWHGIGIALNNRTRPSGQRCVLKHFWAYPLIEMWEMRGGNLSTAIATFSGRYARELFWCYSWLFMPSWSFLYIKLAISCIFHKSITDIRTDGRTDGPTDGRTDGHTLL